MKCVFTAESSRPNLTSHLKTNQGHSLGVTAASCLFVTTYSNLVSEDYHQGEQLWRKRNKRRIHQPRSTPTTMWASLVGPIINHCCTTLGATTLSIPRAIFRSGLVAGDFSLLVSSALTILSVDALIDAIHKGQQFKYQDLVGPFLGKTTKVVTQILIMIFCVGFSTACLTNVKDIRLSLPRPFQN